MLNQSNRSPWHEAVQTAAYQATLKEARLRWGTEDLDFNYRWEHVRAVVRLALRLAELTGADREVVEAAAWLHDICKRGRDDEHGRHGASAARELLPQTDFPPHKIEAVADAIFKHVGLFTHEPIEPLEAAVLWDADKLSKLGATAVLHFAGYRIAAGEGETEELKQRICYQPWQEAAVQSFHTAAARTAGAKRLQASVDFCQQLALEFDGDDLD